MLRSEKEAGPKSLDGWKVCRKNIIRLKEIGVSSPRSNFKRAFSSIYIDVQ